VSEVRHGHVCDGRRWALRCLPVAEDAICTEHHPDTLSVARAYPFLVSGLLIIIGLVATSRLSFRPAMTGKYAAREPRLGGRLPALSLAAVT